jgi:hypothetical protein
MTLTPTPRLLAPDGEDFGARALRDVFGRFGATLFQERLVLSIHEFKVSKISPIYASALCCRRSHFPAVWAAPLSRENAW